MPQPYRTTITATGSTTAYVSTPWSPSYFADPFSIGVGVVSTGSSAATNYTVQHTFDPIFDGVFSSSVTIVAASNANWFSNTGLNGVSSAPLSRDGNYAFPVVGIRLTVTSTATTVVTMTLLQSGS